MSVANYKELVYFDIETVGKYKDLLEYQKEDPRGYDLFIHRCRRRTINTGWQGDCNEAFLEKSALMPEFGNVICVSFGRFKNGEMVVGSYIGEERDIITNAWKYFISIDKINDTRSSINKIKLCGYNIKGFDIPWLNRKFYKYELQIPICLSTYGVKPWEQDTIDLSEIWKNNNFEVVSFDEMAYELGIESPKKLLSGEKIHDYYYSTGDIETIKNYCENDVKTCIEVAEKILLLT